MATQLSPVNTLKHHMAMIVTGIVVLVSFAVFVVLGMLRETIIAIVIMLTVFVPVVIEKWAKLSIPVSVQVQYAVLLLAGPYLGGALGFYEVWLPWDSVVHFYSGIPASFAIITALGEIQRRYHLALPVWFEVIVLLAVKSCVAFLWETGEFVFDLIFGTNTQNDNFDTMTDMLAGLTPALAIAVALVLYRRSGAFRYIGFLLDDLGQRLQPK